MFAVSPEPKTRTSLAASSFPSGSIKLSSVNVVAATSAYLATAQRDLANQARSRAEVEAETAK